MKYYKTDNYISDFECEELIYDAEKLLDYHNFIEVQNNRRLIPSAGVDYQKLIKGSIKWKNLHNRLNSQEFLNFITSNLDIKDTSYKVVNFFYNEKMGNFLYKYKNLHQTKVALINTKSLIKYTFFRILRDLTRVLRFKFSKKKHLELLYDYSISPNGYKREIHRDSDARTFVFLLYLNNLSEKGTGGDLEIYKYKKKSEKIPARPRYEDCDLIEKIPPKPGRIVVFLNSHDSLHAVSEMKNHDGLRHFLYGSFTLLAKDNEFLSKSEGRLKTDYNLFD